jgi:alanyl-tRNA synthetase
VKPSLDAIHYPGTIIKAAAKLLGGSGEGKPELAQGGGPNAEKLD